MVVNADLRSPDKLWRQVMNTYVLDREEPIAVLMFAVTYPSRAVGLLVPAGAGGATVSVEPPINDLTLPGDTTRPIVR